MIRHILRVLVVSAVVVGGGWAIAPSAASADDYWRGYWNWYDNSYRPYYHRYNSYRPNYSYGYRYNYPNYGYRNYGYRNYGYGNDYGYGGGHIQIGPYGFSWR